MYTTILYQTLENRENPDEVESNGPFFCARVDAWLGAGYYFWDGLQELAHWWGRQVYNGEQDCNKYLITEVGCTCAYDDVLDLHGNTQNIILAKKIVDVLLKTHSSKEITVPFFIQYMKSRTSFNYKMIRACGINSFSWNTPLARNSRFYFKSKGDQRVYLDLMPPIQVCVLDKSVLGLPVKIIHPIDYCQD